MARGSNIVRIVKNEEAADAFFDLEGQIADTAIMAAIAYSEVETLIQQVSQGRPITGPQRERALFVTAHVLDMAKQMRRAFEEAAH